MDVLSGKWISGDGFSLCLQSHTNGRIEGIYYSSLFSSHIALDLHGVSINQNGKLTFALVVECDPCRTMGWTGEINLNGSLDEAHSRMAVQWLSSSGLSHPGARPKAMRGKSVLLKLPDNFAWEPCFTSELFAPHTLLAYERSRLIQKNAAEHHQPAGPRVSSPRKKRKL